MCYKYAHLEHKIQFWTSFPEHGTILVLKMEHYDPTIVTCAYKKTLETKRSAALFPKNKALRSPMHQLQRNVLPKNRTEGGRFVPNLLILRSVTCDRQSLLSTMFSPEVGGLQASISKRYNLRRIRQRCL